MLWVLWVLWLLVLGLRVILWVLGILLLVSVLGVLCLLKLLLVLGVEAVREVNSFVVLRACEVLFPAMREVGVALLLLVVCCVVVGASGWRRVEAWWGFLLYMRHVKGLFVGGGWRGVLCPVTSVAIIEWLETGGGSGCGCGGGWRVIFLVEVCGVVA